MSKLYLITGPAGVGKSTVSIGIAESLKKSVLIEGDDIYHQVKGGYIQAWKEGNHLDTFWKVCVGIIKEYLNVGYDVVFNYIISKEKFEELKNIFADIETKFVVLLVEENTLVKRDKERAEDCRMGERCITLLNNFVLQNFNPEHVLYTDNISINDTINIIKNEDRFLL